MAIIKVKAIDTKEILTLNKIMLEYDDINFDVVSGINAIDGKSIIGLLYAMARGQYNIHVIGKFEKIKSFLKSLDKEKITYEIK